MSIVGITTLALLITASGPGTSHGNDDWPSWRGPNLNGIAPAGQTPPTSWDEDTNVKWMAEVPGRGHSSPTIVGDKIFLTTAEQSKDNQSFLCYSRSTGEMLWQTEVSKGGFNPAIHKANTHASPTIVSQDGRIFGTFNNHDGIQLICMDFDGKILWQKVAGPFIQDIPFGYGSSPCLYKDTVIVVSEYSDGFMIAFDQKSGKQVWREAKTLGTSYASPVIANIGGRDQMLFSGCETVQSFDPNNGKEIWKVAGPWKVTCGTMVWNDDMVFVGGGYPTSGVLAIKSDGSEVLWRNKTKVYEQSMLLHEGYLYAQSDRGFAYCWDAKTGEEMWKERLRGPVSSSPVLAGGNVYLTNERGMTYVVKPNPKKFEMVSENQLGDGCLTSLTILNSEIFMRTFNKDDGEDLQWLFCLANDVDGE